MRKVKDRTGEKHMTNKGYKITIINYRNAKDCDIQFEDGTIINIEYSQIKRDKIKNPYKPSVCNIGFIGIGSAILSIDRTETKSYKVWKSMLERCYSEKTLLRQPTYIDCSVCDEWHNFQIFSKWFDENYIEGYQLDKDILLKGNKIYSPDTCIFVPKEINYLFTKKQNNRGGFAIGVGYDNRINKFIARCSIYGKLQHLGCFDTEIEAFNAYKHAKEIEIKRIAELYKNTITDRCYQAMISYIVEFED